MSHERELAPSMRPKGAICRMPVQPEASALPVKETRKAYMEARSEWESTRRGAPYIYIPPRYYDEGRRAVRIDDEIVEGRDGQSVWVKLTAGLADLKFDPLHYITWVFEEAANDRAPEPNAMLNEDRIKAYREYRLTLSKTLAAELQIQLQAAARQVGYHQSFGHYDTVDSHQLVLGNPNLPLSSLFRFCLARELAARHASFARVANSYRHEAEAQLRIAPEAYLRAWGAFIPKDLAASVSAKG